MNLPNVIRGLATQLAVSFGLLSAASAATITWIEPKDPVNSNTNWPAGTAYTNNFGIAFTTGTGGPFNIDWLTLGLNTSTSTASTGTLKVELRGTTNSTAYSAVASTTVYSTDTVSFNKPTTTSTAFNLNLTASDLPSLNAYALQSNTAYALVLYAPSVNIGMGRRTGHVGGTTNAQYTVSNGFTMLNTFRNNGTSLPSLSIAFGELAPSAVPEPASTASALLLAAAGMTLFHRRKR
jgi:hypothetical protein